MNFFETVYKIVSEIPTGKVISYGGVARLAGNPRMARQVGWALHVNPYQGVVPCHRVVMKDGSLSKGFAFGGEEVQRALLEKEGVGFDGQGSKKGIFYIKIRRGLLSRAAVLHVVFVKIFHFKIKSVFSERQDALFYLLTVFSTLQKQIVCVILNMRHNRIFCTMGTNRHFVSLFSIVQEIVSQQSEVLCRACFQLKARFFCPVKFLGGQK